MKSKSFALLFADVVNSTRLYQSLGDLKAQKRIAEALSLLQDIVRDHYGTVIKTIGDEVMASFSGALNALNAALLMQSITQTKEMVEREDGARLRLRIGIHYGPVIEKENDLFGNTVNIASRIVSQAKAKQTLVTKALLDVAGENLPCESRIVDKISLKGINEIHEIHELIPTMDPEGITIATLDNITIDVPEPQTLRLTFQNKEYLIKENQPSISLGRSSDNDLIVPLDSASRIHARIEWKRGKCIVLDQSLNGTFITTQEGNSKLLRRDEMELTGQGYIGLGCIVDNTSPFAIHFSCSL